MYRVSGDTASCHGLISGEEIETERKNGTTDELGPNLEVIMRALHGLIVSTSSWEFWSCGSYSVNCKIAQVLHPSSAHQFSPYLGSAGTYISKEAALRNGNLFGTSAWCHISRWMVGECVHFEPIWTIYFRKTTWRIAGWASTSLARSAPFGSMPRCAVPVRCFGDPMGFQQDEIGTPVLQVPILSGW